jgi:hypothetical protein
MFDGVAPYAERHVDFEGRAPDFEQLFDLEADGREKNNLIEAYEGTALLASLRRECQQRSCDLNRRRLAYRRTHPVAAR